MQWLWSADTAAYLWVAGLPHPLWLDSLMLAATAIGSRGAVWVAMGLVIWLAARGRSAMAVWRTLLAIGLAALVVDGALKPLVARERPFVAHPGVRVAGTVPETSSFPSGHAATAVAGALGLSLAWPRRRALFWALGALIAVSRVYLGVHYPLDVVAGAAAGWGCWYFATAATPRLAVVRTG